MWTMHASTAVFTGATTRTAEPAWTRGGRDVVKNTCASEVHP